MVEAPKSSPHNANERLIWTNDPQILGKLIPWRVAVTRAILIYNCEFGKQLYKVDSTCSTCMLWCSTVSRFYLFVALLYF